MYSNEYDVMKLLCSSVINNPLQLLSLMLSVESVRYGNFRRFRISLHTMDRPDKRKPLTSELKGSLVTLHKHGFSIDEIANEVDCHVSN